MPCVIPKTQRYEPEQPHYIVRWLTSEERYISGQGFGPQQMVVERQMREDETWSQVLQEYGKRGYSPLDLRPFTEAECRTFHLL